MDNQTDKYSDNQDRPSTAKETYYVSVSAGTITKEENHTTDQLSVYATEREIDQLMALFAKRAETDDLTHLRGIIPFKSADHDPATDKYNEQMLDIYRMVFRIGTEETRRHLIHMDILSVLKDPDTHLPGYH
ncbi:hypothetical protein A9X05_01860 [Mycobacterium sp. E3298]|nr:hypothetical protein [Mycobacterium sp. E3298]OBG86323.1 hypothetical protein A9X05_01860 [Mycobacterium sp. E3298]